MLELKGLQKSFGKKAVLRDISFQFEQGVYGLLGPNGAGKTTLIRCITQLYPVRPDMVFYNGTAVAKEKGYLKKIGYLPQKFGMFKELTVAEMMELMANLKGMDKAAARSSVLKAVEQVNLSDRLQSKVGSLSGGMVRRLGVAQALLGDPQVLIFDEPTAGLDPEERLRFKNIIAEIKGKKTILISTHIVEDVEAVCDYVAIMDAGQILTCGTCREIEAAAEGKTYLLPEEALGQVPQPYYLQKHVEQDGKRMVRLLSAQDLPAQPVSPNVEDGYLCVLKKI